VARIAGRARQRRGVRPRKEVETNREVLKALDMSLGREKSMMKAANMIEETKMSILVEKAHIEMATEVTIWIDATILTEMPNEKIVTTTLMESLESLIRIPIENAEENEMEREVAEEVGGRVRTDHMVEVHELNR
jgi:hypothetical protein